MDIFLFEILSAMRSLAVYFIIAASCALICRWFIKIPNELFRKILHLILLGSLAVWVKVFSTWWCAAVSSLIFALAVYPLLCLAEKIKGYSGFVTERKQGELKSSLLLVFFMFSFVITVCWGLFKDKYLVLASVYAWGFGDAAAALVGKNFGRHHISGRFIDGKKSIEGSFAMFVVSFISVLSILFLRGGLPFSLLIFCSALTAIVSTVTELCSFNGRDTLFCPLASMGVLLTFLCAAGRISV